MPACLTRHRRLSKPEEFSRAFAQGKRRRKPPLALVYRHTASETEPRLGLAISRKQARSAVLRNRIKRQAREIFRLRAGEMPGGDYVVYALANCEGMHKRELGHCLQALFDGAGRP